MISNQLTRRNAVKFRSLLLQISAETQVDIVKIVDISQKFIDQKLDFETVLKKTREVAEQGFYSSEDRIWPMPKSINYTGNSVLGKRCDLLQGAGCNCGASHTLSEWISKDIWLQIKPLLNNKRY